MKTIVIQIGNTDDKLTQLEWKEFVQCVRNAVARWAESIHFFGASCNYEAWQNAAWIVSCKDRDIGQFHSEIVNLRTRFRQDSAAWLEGETQFV